jgi:hypothetical protein
VKSFSCCVREKCDTSRNEEKLINQVWLSVMVEVEIYLAKKELYTSHHQKNVSSEMD